MTSDECVKDLAGICELHDGEVIPIAHWYARTVNLRALCGLARTAVRPNHPH